MSIKTLLTAFALLVVASSFSAFTFVKNADLLPKWELLGSRKVNYGLDKDEIAVTAREGRFTALKLVVKRGGINLHRLAVHFGNGEVEELEVRENIPADGESRVLDLPGNKRVISKVVFWYDTKNYANQKAVVNLWGRN
ncbi:MAG: hypothetical protein ACK4TA_22105 [Saprospiraceae bacterium]